MKLWLWRGLRHRRWQAAALAVSLALSVALLVATVVLAEGVKSGLEISAQRLGADLVLIPRAVQVRQPEALLFGGETVPAYMPASLEAQARQTEGVQAVTAQFFLQTLEKNCCDLDSPKQLIGYDAPTDWVVTSWTKEGAPAIKDDEIVVGAGISAVQTQELAVLGRFFKIRSVLPETGTALDNSLFISLAEARSLANGSPEMQNLWQENGPPSALISALLIRLKPEADVWQVRQALSELGPVQVLAAGESKKRVEQAAGVMTEILGGVAALVAVAALGQLFLRFYSFIRERRTEWALYIALGASAKRVAVMVLAEAAVLSLAAAVAGVTGGALFGFWLLETLLVVQSVPVVLPSGLWLLQIAVWAVLGTVLAGLAAAAFPAWRCGHTKAETILRV